MKNLDDIELERELLECVRKETESSIDVLRYLREIERKKLHLERGYPSLYAYCTERLQYSEPAAQVRIASMRLMRRVEGVEGRLARRTLSLSVAALLYSVIRKRKMGREESEQLVRELAGTSKRVAQREIARRYPELIRPERRREVDGEHTEVTITLNRAEIMEVERALDITSHTNFERSYKTFLLQCARNTIKKHEGKPRKDLPQHGPAKVSRHVSAAIRREVWKRDQGRCQYVDPLTGRKCNGRHGLQLDHIRPFSEGGPTTVGNLRLLCGAHNRWQNGR